MTTQVEAVLKLMKDGRWYTPSQISIRTGISLGAGLYARIRDLRKFEHGGYVVESRPHPHTDGDWQYRLCKMEAGRFLRRRRTAEDKLASMSKAQLIAEVKRLRQRNRGK